MCDMSAMLVFPPFSKTIQPCSSDLLYASASDSFSPLTKSMTFLGHCLISGLLASHHSNTNVPHVEKNGFTSQTQKGRRKNGRILFDEKSQGRLTPRDPHETPATRGKLL